MGCASFRSSSSAAIFLTALSSLGFWLDGHGMLDAAPATISCFVGYLAAAAYALGPAWQIEAIRSGTVTGWSLTSVPSALEAPTTCPPLMPPPAKATLKTFG